MAGPSVPENAVHTCPPRAGLNRVPTRTSALPRHLSPAGGGESASADLGVEFWRLDFGVWLAAHSVPSQRGGYPDGQTQGSAPTPGRVRAGVAKVYPGYAATGAIRMGRHRGLPLHRDASASGLPRYILVTQPLGLSGWADTGVCPYTGTRPRQVAEVHPGCGSRRGYPDGQTQGSAPTPERGHVGVAEVDPGYAAASELARYIQVARPRRS